MKDFSELVSLQKDVIKVTYLIVLLSSIVLLFLGNYNFLLSMLLGSALSLLYFNSKINNLKNNSKRVTGSVFNYFLYYLMLFVILVVAKQYSNLNVWVVFIYAFLTNIILIFWGIKEYFNNRK